MMNHSRRHLLILISLFFNSIEIYLYKKKKFILEIYIINKKYIYYKFINRSFSWECLIIFVYLFIPSFLMNKCSIINKVIY